MLKGAPPYSYRTILLKLSGELLGGKSGSGLEAEALNSVAAEIAELAGAEVRIGIVVGGGNFFRGGSRSKLPVSAFRGHQMGMLFTIANAMALEQCLLKAGAFATVQSAVAVPAIVEQFTMNSSQNHLNEGNIVIFAGGTGHTHVSTDTAAAIRAVHIGADVLLKATKVDGVYDADPNLSATAKRYDVLTHDKVLKKNLRVMDAPSIALCREHRVPVRVFDASVRGGIVKAGLGHNVGTLVSTE